MKKIKLLISSQIKINYWNKKISIYNQRDRERDEGWG